MRLEKLEIEGFKSFADKTEFIFQPGLTAFVGPNGCGKSNIVDAVKWVLGEQSVKALRGNEMQDVIFNGSPSRRSTGYAQATLTLSNTKGLLPTEYETVSITRRLYRSGESEYYLNKQRCRLRDIRELFMDTGIGMNAYSIIEQGKVDVLLTANKQDRRAIFEEAAGISKYKAQKRTCLAKLERVHINLQRLGDIIDEVEKRMRSVKYQAAKARRWKRLDDQKRELSVALALHKYELLVRDRDETGRRLAELNAEVDGLHAAIERTEAELSELETAVIEADQHIARLQGEDIRISSRLQAAEDAIRMNQQALADLAALEESTKADIAKTEAALEMMRAELERVAADADELGRTLETGQADLDARERAVRDAEARLRSLHKTIDDQRSRAVDLAGERARYNNELAALAAQRKQLEHQDRRLAERAAEHRRQLEDALRRRDELAAQGDHRTQHLAALEHDRAAIERQREELARRLDDIAERTQARRSELASARSRAELLRDLENKREGIDAGVRRVVEAARGEAPEVPGVRGVLADLIEVDIEHAAAIEAALGPHQQLVLTDSIEATCRAMAFLAQDGKGRASFLSLDAVQDDTDAPPSPPQEPGVVGRALDLVRFPVEWVPVLRHLLGDVVVVSDLATARRIAAGGRARTVTLDGQLLDPRGISTGGSARGAPGVLSRRSELRALDVRLAQLDADIAVLDREREEARRNAEELERRHRDLAQQITAAQAEVNELQAELGKLDDSIQRFQSELATSDDERAEIASDLDALAAREAELRREAARVEEAETELRTALAEAQRQLAEVETERDQLRTAVSELAVALAQRREKHQSLLRRRNQLEQDLDDRQKHLETARQQVEQGARRRREAHQAILDRKRETSELLDRRGKLGIEKAEAANRKQLIRVEYDTKRNERDEARRRAKNAEAEQNKLQVHAREIALRLETLEGRTRSEFGCSLADQSLPADAAPRDWDQVEKEIEILNQKMKSMGAVNTYAIAELEELEQRAGELHSQRDDLQKAEHTLREIVRRINRKSREMFRKTFEDVREHFQGVFRKLFGGGRADIVLEEDVDILDAGIEIVACPPGKEPRSITLLSGGEKTLTAIALLFAIFESKPSPFCILDEVDAALDENNIDRFCLMVREFLKESQFLVVTHSRRTMAMADVLYGITMQEPGVSTKVAVRFEDEAEMEAAG